MKTFILLGLIVPLVSCKPRGPETTSGVLSAPASARSLDAYDCPASGKVKVAFFDADSTLRVPKGPTVTPNGPDDVNLLPFVGPKIAELNQQGYLIAIVSNQLGVQQGKITDEAAAGALVTTAQLIAERGGRVDWIGYAPADDELRKPKTGMAKQVIDAVQAKCQLEVDLSESFMVGDSGYLRGKDGPHPDGRGADDFSNADRRFAENLGVPFHEPTDFFGWKAFRVYNMESQGELEDFLITIENRGTAEQKEEATALRRVNQMPNRAIRFVHYNIKELRTDKLIDMNDGQVTRAAQNLRELNPDLVSINEIQYDLPDIPTQGLPGTGDNMRRLMERVKLPGGVSSWSFNLAQANTGKRAKKQADGNYAINPNGPGADQLADQVSFGTFPGQYSTGFGTRFAIKRNTVFTNTPWREWDANFKAGGNLQLPNGQPVPDDMELFDKNFNDSLVDLDGREAHVITFHTVPAFGFGGSADLNVARNAAQLAFLEWYLLGRCDPSATHSAVKRCEAGIEPLPEGAAFIAVGDLNVDWGTDSPGAATIKAMLANPKVHDFRADNLDLNFRIDSDKHSHVTYMSDGVDLGKIQSELDYFIVSKRFKVDTGRIHAPLSAYKEHSCHATKAKADQAKAQAQVPDDQEVSVSTRFADDGTRSYCVVSVNREFAAFRKGSDHLPMYLTFHWAD